jgi:hypothetical protein
LAPNQDPRKTQKADPSRDRALEMDHFRRPIAATAPNNRRTTCLIGKTVQEPFSGTNDETPSAPTRKASRTGGGHCPCGRVPTHWVSVSSQKCPGKETNGRAQEMQNPKPDSDDAIPRRMVTTTWAHGLGGGFICCASKHLGIGSWGRCLGADWRCSAREPPTSSRCSNARQQRKSSLRGLG